MRTRVNRGVYDDKDKNALIDMFIQTFNFAFFVMFGEIRLMCIITDRDEYIKFIRVIETSHNVPQPWRGEMVFDRIEMTTLLNTIDFPAIEHVDDIDYFYEQLMLTAKARISVKGRRREILAKIGKKPRTAVGALDRYYLLRIQRESSTAGEKNTD